MDTETVNSTTNNNDDLKLTNIEQFINSNKNVTYKKVSLWDFKYATYKLSDIEMLALSSNPIDLKEKIKIRSLDGDNMND